MKVRINEESLEGKLKEKKDPIPLSFSADTETVIKLERLQKHYNVKSRSKMLSALVHSAHELINIKTINK